MESQIWQIILAQLQSAFIARICCGAQDGVTNRKFAILQGALWCKGYNPGYNLSETEDGTVVFNGVFDADVEKAIIELKKMPALSIQMES